MIKEIHYSGYSSVPSDYEAPDGSLAACVDLIPEDGALRPITPAQPLTDDNGNLLPAAIFIHASGGFRHFIVDNGDGSFGWYSQDSPANIKPIGSVSGFNGVVSSVGNTLIFLTDTGMSYWLWKNGGYKYLGTHIPELPLSFGLQAEIKQSYGRNAEFEADPIHKYQNLHELTTTQQNALNSAVMAEVNKFVADHKKYFTSNFFVRYALRLYDGSLVMHSAPVYMNLVSGYNPHVIANGYAVGSDDNITQISVYAIGLSANLDYALLKSEYKDAFADWSDIVESVDIFVSAPLYRYDQSGKCKRIWRWNPIPDSATALFERYQWGDFTCRLPKSKDYSAYYMTRNLQNYIKAYKGNNMPGIGMCPLPLKSHKAFEDEVTGCSNFYLFRSLKISELSTERTILEPESDDYLTSLVACEVMTDDYDSHDTLIPKQAYTYNNRLNLASVEKALFHGFHPQTLMEYTDAPQGAPTTDLAVASSSQVDTVSDAAASGSTDEGGSAVGSGDDTATPANTYHISTYFTVEEDDKEIVVTPKHYYGTSGFASVAYGQMPPYLFFPNINAKYVTLERSYNLNMKEILRVPMKEHPTLSGSYCYLGLNTAEVADIKGQNSSNSAAIRLNSVFPGQSVVEHIPEPADKDIVTRTNRIYLSEVNNPFYFPASLVTSVGTGEVFAMCAAARPLSEGQFGQFPLYAFATDGVWALEVSSTGTYSARQPITRDVCINSAGITQLDSSVLFPTKRGIIEIAGSQTRCITDAVNSDHPFDVTTLPSFSRINAMFHTSTPDKCLPTLPFRKFLEQCRMIYDYLHQRIVVYAPEVAEYAYVYSLKSQQWGIMHSSISHHLNSYPDAYAVSLDGNIVDFGADFNSPSQGLVVSRPLAFGDPNILKTVDTIIQRGMFRKGHVQSVLYGSRDLYSWHLVWSSKDHFMRGFHGSPYKYFRIALLCNLDADESVNGASVQFTPKLINQLR